MSSKEMQWPDDADADVLRRMKAGGFDFSQSCSIEFNVDFERWPPSPAAMRRLEQQYPSAKAYPSASGGGYVQFQIYGKLTYELVIATQRDVSAQMAEFGGNCESWGVLH